MSFSKLLGLSMGARMSRCVEIKGVLAQGGALTELNHQQIRPLCCITVPHSSCQTRYKTSLFLQILHCIQAPAATPSKSRDTLSLKPTSSNHAVCRCQTQPKLPAAGPEALQHNSAQYGADHPASQPPQRRAV